MNEDLLSIGDVAEIYRISIKTLRHYDKLGIIKPAYVDPIISTIPKASFLSLLM